VMSYKTKAIRCFTTSIAGWLVFVGGFVYIDKSPIENDFSFLINYSVFLCVVIIASIIQLISLVCSGMLLLQGSGQKKIYIITIISAILYALYVSIAFCQHWI